MKRDNNKDAQTKGQPPEKKRKLAVREDVVNLVEPHPNYNADITKILKGTERESLLDRSLSPIRTL